MPPTVAPTVLYTYILLLGAAFTVLVLLVSKCDEHLNTSRHTGSDHDTMVIVFLR